MASAIEKITAEAKKMQKSEPNAKWVNLIKKASAKYRAGSLGTVTKKAPVKKRVIASVPKKIAGKPATKRKRIAAAPVRVIGAKGSGLGAVYDRGSELIGQINGLEKARKQAKGKHEKDFIQVIINGKHDQLDAITKKTKR